MPRRPPDFSGGFGYGPVPDTDVPFVEQPGGGHYEDGYRDRFPGGTRYENPSDYWLDCIVYPDRKSPGSDAEAAQLDSRSRWITISAGNATGWRNGPGDED